MRGEAHGTGRINRALWYAAAVAILVLLVWWAARAYRARELAPAEPPAGPTSALPPSVPEAQGQPIARG